MKVTLAGRDEKMLMKLIVERATDRVLGCHVLGTDAAEIVQMAAIAMRMGATKADFDATMALASERGRGTGNHARKMDAARSGCGVACGPVGATSAGGGENPWRHDEA